MLVKLHAIMWLQGMFSKLGFPILTTYCGANFVPWWLGSFWYFLIDLIPGSSLALDCYAMYVWHFFSVIFYWDHTSGKIYVRICGWYIDICELACTFCLSMFRCWNATSSTALSPAVRKLILNVGPDPKDLALLGHCLKGKILYLFCFSNFNTYVTMQ